MIVPMHKLAVIARSADADAVLETLRETGAVHVASRPAPSESLEAARAELDRLRRALAVLPENAPKAPTGRKVREVVAEVLDTVHDKKARSDRLDALRLERERVVPLGDFDPERLAGLADKGVFVRLYHAGPKAALPDVEGAAVEVLSAGMDGTWFALISRDPDLRAPADPVKLPETSLSQLDKDIEAQAARLAEDDEHLRALARERPAVAKLVHQAEERVRFLEVRAALTEDGSREPLCMLDGWIPVERASDLEAAAARAGFAYTLGAPEPHDEPPTLIRNPRWVRPIKAVFDMIGVVPGYRETDFSWAFLLFLSLFFAMLVGDAGYGALFAGITWAARRKFPAARREPFTLLYVMAAATIVWGVLTGTYFGIEELPAPLAGLKIGWLTDPGAEKNLMLLCFLIGATHLTLAHAWNVVRLWPSLQVLAQLGWIATTWTMFFAARSMVLLEPFPEIMLFVLGAGVVLILAFMTPPARLKTQWFDHVMLPLNLIGNFVDVVSYVRLFAVGAATFAVASAFNNMAAGIFDGPLTALVSALILFLGHGLNILLAAMGVLVHGVRLNTLEFATHLNLQWKGKPYQPFARRRGDDDA